ncbi:hypothetical protein [Streptomyces pinistramenti]|uniref:hypothetical protein n=1 Tax=Streptomyces pinistramenti TaxID=2884812 RepID=UPI001D08EE39|nr:hypothetical protein [Streptomyces pinistramenti]MCB5909886.1 hypothetical protein [Streptomyces pinistramenti]
MRPSQDPGTHGTGVSPTPIYDALYAEYRRAFRALPGDRSGEGDGPDMLHGNRNWSRTTASPGNWEVVARQPYTPRAALPALPPGRRDARPHGR